MSAVPTQEEMLQEKVHTAIIGLKSIYSDVHSAMLLADVMDRPAEYLVLDAVTTEIEAMVKEGLGKIDRELKRSIQS